VALAAGVLWIVVRSRLRPLERIAGEIGRLDPNDLSARVRLSGAPLEIQPIAERLNGLLSKLEAAFERERSLTADVAHELRTPLAGIRSTIDVALSRPRQESDYREALDQCRAIAIQMQEMVENLLSLARIEAGLVAIEARRISIEERLRAVWSPLEARAASRRLRVEWSIDDALPVSTDPTLLDVVLRNIIQNAVEYADEGGTVAIDAASSAAGLEVSVRNSGSRLDQDAAHQVFQRFWRGDAVRSDAGAHCGAGLALVESVVALLGGSVEVSCRAGGEFKIGVSIPSRAAGAAPDRDAPVEGRPPRGHDQR
jgi:signal transduction histidine kinase